MQTDQKLDVLIPLKVHDGMACELTQVAGGERKRQGFIRGVLEEKLEKMREANGQNRMRDEIIAHAEALGFDETFAVLSRALVRKKQKR